MSRIRTIKPDFFIDDELAELSPLNRLLFVGLWTLADCKGRLEDRPKRIRAQVHPFDDGDTDAMLQALHDHGFVQRYEVGGKRYLEIRTFTKHQRLTGKEAESESHIPAPPTTVQPPVEAVASCRIAEMSNHFPVPSIATSCNTEDTKSGETTGKYLSFPNAQEVEGKGKEKEGERKGSGTEGSMVSATPRARTLRQPMPPDFGISDATKTWAEAKGYTDLESHLEAFKDKAVSKGYQYVDWEAALKIAIREDWAGLRTQTPSHTNGRTKSVSTASPWVSGALPTTREERKQFLLTLDPRRKLTPEEVRVVLLARRERDDNAENDVVADVVAEEVRQ